MDADDRSCDVAGCPQPASVSGALAGVLVLAPRRTSVDPVPLCGRHASEIAAEVGRQLGGATVPDGPSRNRTNRAIAGEDLGDAEG